MIINQFHQNKCHYFIVMMLMKVIMKLMKIMMMKLMMLDLKIHKNHQERIIIRLKLIME